MRGIPTSLSPLKGSIGPELDTAPATGSLWGLANTGKASWGGGVVNWSCTYQGIFVDHKRVTCRCVARGGHRG